MLRPLTPLDFLARSAAVYPDRVAVVGENRQLTYREFQERVHRFASALRARGVVPGDRVAILAPNTALALEAQFAVPLCGAIVVMLNIRLQTAELAWILNHCGAKGLVADPDLLPVIEPALDQLGCLEFIVSDYEEMLDSAALPFTPFEVADENSTIAINYTSGTTGNPKGVMYSHRGAYLNALGEVIEHGHTCRTVYLWTVPLFHCNGWCHAWAITAVGGRHVLLHHFDADVAVRLIQSEGVTHLCGAPVVISTLARYCASNGIRINGVNMVTGGAPPSPAVIRAVEEIGATLTHIYGLTETYGPHTICAWRPEWDALPLAERAERKARQGVAYAIHGSDLRVVDADMRDVPADGATMGEVVMRGNNVMPGYYNNPDATRAAFDGGWFHSGDIGVMHPDGYIEIRDRGKDIVISGGENISSIEVEKTIYEHPAVMEAAVVAIPDDHWGEVPKAFVALKPGADAEPADIVAFCRERLAHFKCPKQVEFGPLPKTATGKIRKNVLREKEWAGREKRVN